LHHTPTLFSVNIRRAEQSAHGGPFSVKMVSAGRSVYHFAKHTFEVQPGAMLLVPAGERYWTQVGQEGAAIRTAYVPDRDLREAISALCDPVEELLEGRSSARGDLSFSPHHRTLTPEVQKIAGELFSSSNAGPESQRWHDFVGHVAQLVADATRAIANIAASKKSIEQELFRRVSLARHLIVSDPSATHSLEHLASISNLSAFYFQRVFAKAFGETPSRMRCRIRIEHAKRLLTSGHVNIETVAARIGYQDHAAFSRAFRRETGISPLQFRRGSQRRPTGR
jgi:AraC-like DNA-binding protein